jgi:uncharacterized protein (TIGR02117 family)
MILNILKKIGKIVLGFILFIFCWLLLAWLLPYLKVGTPTTSEKNITLFIKTNGVHVEIIMPKNSSIINWNEFIDEKLFPDVDSSFDHLSVGWGDKGFYLNTPTWGDLKASTAVNAIFGLGGTAMHVSYQKISNDPEIKKLNISNEEYLSLVNYIKSSFEMKNDSIQLIKHPLYGNHDNYFEAKGKYSLFKTCNVWAGNALKAANVRIGVWTPLSFGIMNHLE